jgi:hypothetical protein
MWATTSRCSLVAREDLVVTFTQAIYGDRSEPKLGCLVGHIFARCGDRRLSAESDRRGEFSQLASRFAVQTCERVDARRLRQVKREAQKDATLTDDAIRQRIESARSVSQWNEIMSRVCSVIQEKYPTEYERLRNLQQTMESDPEIKTLQPG